MMKYEKPQLVEIDKLGVVMGFCEDGTSNIETCVVGDAVVPGCVNGTVPTTDCGGGGAF